MISELQALSVLTLPDATWSALEKAYVTPPRAYHSLEHIVDVARLWSKEEWGDRTATFLAVLFHDAVYDPGRNDNEIRSAVLCEQLCGPNPRATRLIQLTALHGKLKPEDVDSEAAKFLDCDTAIVGASPERFARYEQQIAEEYVPVVGRATYAHGRRRFLKRLLDAPRIFLSDVFHARLDAQARENLRAALK